MHPDLRWHEISSIRRDTRKLKAILSTNERAEWGGYNQYPPHLRTVKSKKLMRHLVRLVTPPKGRVLDPFCGSGSTIVAALEEGMSGVGIEREAEFHRIASARVAVSLKKLTNTQDYQDFFEE